MSNCNTESKDTNHFKVEINFKTYALHPLGAATALAVW
jgi:hypothetical protein